MNRYKLLALLLALLLVLSISDTKTTGQDSKKIEELVQKIDKKIDESLQHLRKNILNELLQGLNSATKSHTAKQDNPKESKEKALEIITADLLKGYVEYLASDELEGRCAGKPGEVKATEYIAKHFKEAGLKAIGDKDEDGNPTYYQKTGKGKARNCVALLEGSDEKLKDEIIVIGGHHDGQGKRGEGVGQMPGGPKDDDIWNSADDNASGTSIVMVAAKAFGESGLKPKRSILFMTFSGEEFGLVGSAYYAKHPLLSIKNHVAMLNFDMVGRGKQKSVIAMGVGTFKDSKIIEDIFEKAGKGQVLKIVCSAGAGGGSDHSSFLAKGIPAVFFHAGLHEDYHRKTDHADKLNYDTMALIGKSAFLILNEIGNMEKVPEYSKKQPGPRPPHDMPEGPPRLGIYPDDEFGEDDIKKLREDRHIGDGEGAIKVGRVSEGGAGDKAGIKEGDILISLGGEKFPEENPLSKLQSILSKVERGKEYEIEVIREGKKITLKATWPKIKKDKEEK